MKTKKRHIALLLLVILTIAAIIGAAFANSIVLKPASSVEITQVESIGDPAAASGLKLTMKLPSSSDLYWDTTGHFGETGPTFTTSHSYRQKYINTARRDSLYLYPDVLQIPEILELVESTAASQDDMDVKTLKIDLSEYAEYVPLSIWAERNSGDFISGISRDSKTRLDENNSWNKVLDSLNDDANSFLKIPVQKGATLVIRLIVYSRSGNNGTPDYDATFRFENWEGINSYGYRGDVVCSGPKIGDAYYVYMQTEFAGCKLTDGPGIYRIPLEDVDHEEIPMINKAVRVCAFEEGEEVFAGSMMSDPAALAVITAKDGALKEYVLGGPETNDLQVLELGTYPDPGKYESQDLSFMQVHFYNDYNALRIPGERWIVVQRAADGTCHTFDFPETEEDLELDKGQYEYMSSQYEYMSAAFDGKRLAVAGPLYKVQLDDPYGAIRFSGVRLSVYTEDGLQYYGAWTSSLKDDPYIHPSGAYYTHIHDHTLNPSTYDSYWIDQRWN
ncbi:MAG: hypothetical protein IJM39_03475 [Firmicutes bacterium]|nr:hypothetical protein [Bacillota bacterium]